jgi:hypothetical protein
MTNSNLEFVLRPSDSVRKVENQDGAVLLDLRQGLCLSMTPVGVKIWSLLAQGCSLEQITESLAAQFRDVERQQIYHDLIKYVTDLGNKGLLMPPCGSGKTEPPSVAVRFMHWWRRRADSGYKGTRPKNVRLLELKALVGLLVFDCFRFGKNFTLLYRFVQGWSVFPSSVSPDVVALVERAINYACVWYPKRVLCLQRSAVTTCLLRSCGVQARMVLGAQKTPFKAHAWTEVDGEAINERRNVQSLYLIWERC